MLKKLFLYILILGGSLVFFSIFVLVFLNGTALHCVQQPDQTYTCTAQTLLLGKFPTFNRQIEQVTGARTASDDCNDGCSYRTEFTQADGSSTPLNEVYSDKGPVERQTNELNSLLKNDKAEFDYYRKPLWWVAYLIGGLFLMEFVMLTFGMGASAFREYLRTRDTLPN